MPRPGRLTLAAAALLLLFAAQTAHADPFVFSDVRAVQRPPNGTSTSVFTDLFANPGVVLTNGTRVAFAVSINRTVSVTPGDTLRLTVGLPNGLTLVEDIVIQIPLFNLTTTFVVIPGFDLPTYYEPRPFTLTVDLLGSNFDFVIPSGPNAGQRVNSYTYTFSVVQPAPEPATVLLLATGLGGVAAAARRRRRRRE